MVVMIRRNSFINCPFIRGARMATTARGPCSLQHIVTNLSMLETKSSAPPFGKVERRWSLGWRISPLISTWLQPGVNGGNEGERFQPLLRARASR